MSQQSSRRNFLAAGLGAPALLSAMPQKSAPASSAGLNPAVKLAYRTLGKTGLKVTTMGFGCMITSDQSVVERAADLGINYFDTARGYQGGNNERMVGAALKSRRKNLHISTKSHSRSKTEAIADLDTSLRELQTDYVDIWYLHAVGNPSELKDELLEAQAEAKKSGKIRFAGVSTHGGHKDVIPALAANKHFDVVLTTYNFAMAPEMEGLLKGATEAGLGVVAMKVMAGGQRRTGNAPARAKEVLKREGAMLAALKWVIRNPNVHTTIPSITDMDQLDENVKAMAAPFASSDGKILEARLREIGSEYCRMCGSCTGTCAQGLLVADINRYLMYAEGYGEFSLGRENFRLLPAGMQDVRCDDCAECSVHCPNGVRVVQRMSRAQECFA